MELSKIGTRKEWYITANYVPGDDGTARRVNLSQRKIKNVTIPLPYPDPESCAEIVQEGNGTMTDVTEVKDNETVTMANMVVADPVVDAKVEKTPEEAPLRL